MLDTCLDLARRTQIPLIVICSKAVRANDVIKRASETNIEAFALDLRSDDSLGISFGTSNDEFADANLKWNRDLSKKRNLGLILARLRRWKRLMFLDDDIYGITKEDVDALATALDDHRVSALIPEEFPDNSVVCHAHRLSGGLQKVFASASGIGVRCDRRHPSFFPNIYNEDWFFFSGEAARKKIAKVGESRQLKYDPYEDPLRAAQEEFGDLLAEGLYARLDRDESITDVDVDYWNAFIARREAFHQRVAEALNEEAFRKASDSDFVTKALGARESIRAAQNQLTKITAPLCQRFVQAWQSDLTNWRQHLAAMPYYGSTARAFEYLERRLGLAPAVSSPNIR